MKLISLAFALSVAWFAISCSQHKPAGDVLAKVGDTVITRQAFAAELERRARQGKPATASDREALLQEMIRVETFYAKATAAGFAERPEIKDQFKKMLAGRYEQEEWKKQPEVKSPEAGEIDLFYRNHKEQFTAPEKIHVAVIVIKVPDKVGPEQAGAFEKRAAEIRQRALDREEETFGLLAQEMSDDQSTRYRGGDCGWVTRQSLKLRGDAAVLEAIFALKKPGEISPVIRAADGFYLAKLIERKPAETAPLEAVRDRIEHLLLAARQKQAREEFERAQRAGLTIEINSEMLKTIEPPAVVAQHKESTPPLSPSP